MPDGRLVLCLAGIGQAGKVVRLCGTKNRNIDIKKEQRHQCSKQGLLCLPGIDQTEKVVGLFGHQNSEQRHQEFESPLMAGVGALFTADVETVAGALVMAGQQWMG